MLESPPPAVRLEAFGDSTLDLALLVWIESACDDNRIASELRFAIDRAFRQHGVSIPFPQRDLHLVSGRLGGAVITAGQG